MELLIVACLAVPILLPLATWIGSRRTRRRVDTLEAMIAEHRAELRALSEKLRRLTAEPTPDAQLARVAPEVVSHPAPLEAAPMVAAALEPEPPLVAAPLEAAPLEAAPLEAALPEATPLEPEPMVSAHPEEVLPVAEPVPVTASAAESIAPAAEAGFDLESLVGVKLFSAIAGIALVIAAIFFLRYSIEAGWLQPAVRVAIGVILSILLLAACEMKAARRYPATANALDAAAVAILFATFYAAHARWALIGSGAAFVLMAAVTAVAAWLSIRRESLFIAVLGLLGGFATPALLSTGENQPIPLFTYLALLNVGLAWVAYRQNWPVLTTLTVVFTAIYQWGWVLRFLADTNVTLAMGIFLLFPVLSIAGLVLARRPPPGIAQSRADLLFERSALVAAGLPLLFAVYLGAVPAYAVDPALLFGFLLLVDAGLLAIAIARREPLLHVAGAVVTLLTLAGWLASSYTSAASTTVLAFCAAFVLFFLAAPLVAARFRTAGQAGDAPIARGDISMADAEYASPMALFALPVLARLDPGFSAPFALFATLLVLLLVITWRAIVSRRGGLYFVAAFFAVATEAVWSAMQLDAGRTPSAIAIYAVFGVVFIFVPVAARRLGAALQPRQGSGIVMLGSLALLLYLSRGGVAPAALWGLALLLAILNAGLFVESAAGGLPLVSILGSLLSWFVLDIWWLSAADAVGLGPALAVITGLALITFAGFAWSSRTRREPGESRPFDGAQGRPEPVEGRIPNPASRVPNPGLGFSDGLYLGLVAHLFLFTIAVSPQWSLPPWLWFASLAVVTAGCSAVSRWTSVRPLQAVGTVAAAAVVTAWAVATAQPRWADVAIIASAAVGAFALAWMYIEDEAAPGRAAAMGALLLGEVTAMATTGHGALFGLVVVAHVVNLALLVTLASRAAWWGVVPWLVVPAWGAVATEWQVAADGGSWAHLFIVSVAVYAVFIAYPLVLGARSRLLRQPYLAAVLASAVMFIGARAAMDGLGFGWMIGALPVAQAAVMALLLRELLRLQPDGARDLGRLALVAGATLALVTVAIPLQLENQWVTLGWALEGAALAWLYRRIPHRGLLAWSGALLAAVFVRLAANPWVFYYEPRGPYRIVNWYLYAYVVSAAAFLLAAWWLTSTDDRAGRTRLRVSHLLSAGAVILLFVILNIEIADFYATGPAIVFRFGESVSQDLTYTIGWLAFGILLLAACIYLRSHAGRVAAIALIAVTTFKCFLYDLASLEGLYRVGSFVGLAVALALVSLALQKYVLARPRGEPGR